MSNNNILMITDMGEEKEAIDGRHYRTIKVKPKVDQSLINPTSGHKRVIWDQQPLDGDKNDYYDQIVTAFNKWQNENGPQPMLRGSIETVKTKPYFIESENGKYTHPETGNPANKATQKTYVVFPDETVERHVNSDSDDIQLAESEEQENTQASQELEEEIPEEDKEEVSVT